MKLKLSPFKGLVGCVGILGCTCQIATADTSLADKSLARVIANNSNVTIQTTTVEPKKTRTPSLKPVSKFDSFITKAHTITHAGGVFGKNVKPIIKKHIVGLQYSARW